MLSEKKVTLENEAVCHKCFKMDPELVLGFRKDWIFFLSELQSPTLPSDGADWSRERTLGLTGVYTFESSLWNRCFYFIFFDFQNKIVSGVCTCRGDGGCLCVLC